MSAISSMIPHELSTGDLFPKDDLKKLELHALMGIEKIKRVFTLVMMRIRTWISKKDSDQKMRKLVVEHQPKLSSNPKIAAHFRKLWGVLYPLYLGSLGDVSEKKTANPFPNETLRLIWWALYPQSLSSPNMDILRELRGSYCNYLSIPKDTWDKEGNDQKLLSEKNLADIRASIETHGPQVIASFVAVRPEVDALCSKQRSRPFSYLWRGFTPEQLKPFNAKLIDFEKAVETFWHSHPVLSKLYDEGLSKHQQAPSSNDSVATIGTPYSIGAG